MCACVCVCVCVGSGEREGVNVYVLPAALLVYILYIQVFNRFNVVYEFPGEKSVKFLHAVGPFFHVCRYEMFITKSPADSKKSPALKIS